MVDINNWILFTFAVILQKKSTPLKSALLLLSLFALQKDVKVLQKNKNNVDIIKQLFSKGIIDSYNRLRITRLKVNLRPRVDIFKMKLRPCQDHVCQHYVGLFFKTMSCLSRPCHFFQDFFSRFFQDLSNLIQFDPI